MNENIKPSMKKTSNNPRYRQLDSNQNSDWTIQNVTDLQSDETCFDFRW